MAIDFSFPAWLRDQHSFADSLLKGAQVGAIIANNRYRNQALAAQAMQAEREYELRDRQLAAQVRTDDLNYRLKSQLIEDQTSDKAAISEWIQQRNKLSPEARLEMSMPELRLPQSYNIANQIVDNDRMVFEQSIDGQTKASLTRRLAKLDADDIFRFRTATDPDEQIAILEAGEAKVFEREKALRAVGPEIAAQNRLDIAELNAETRENVQKLKNQARTDITKGVSEAQFVTRELGRFMDQLLTDRVWAKKSAPERLAYATRLLQQTYQEAGLGTTATPPSALQPPAIGEVRRGYEYKGGDPANENSWKKVQ